MNKEKKSLMAAAIIIYASLIAASLVYLPMPISLIPTFALVVQAASCVAEIQKSNRDGVEK